MITMAVSLLFVAGGLWLLRSLTRDLAAIVHADTIRHDDEELTMTIVDAGGGRHLVETPNGVVYDLAEFDADWSLDDVMRHVEEVAAL